MRTQNNIQIARNYCIEHSDVNVSLSQSYTEIYSYLGFGLIEEIAVRFDDNDITFKVEVDNRIIIEIRLKEIEEMSNKSHNNSPMQALSFNESKKAILFYPKLIVRCKDSFKVFAKGNSNKTRKCKGYIIAIDKIEAAL